MQPNSNNQQYRPNNSQYTKNEDKINSRDMVKNLIIGIIIMFVIAVGAPLLIEGLSAWVGTETTAALIAPVV